MSILPQMLVRTQAQGRFFPSLIETRNQALLVQMADNAIHWINLYPLDSAIGFPNHPLNSELSGFDRLPWPVDSAIQLLPNNRGQRSVWDRSHVNSLVYKSLVVTFPLDTYDIQSKSLNSEYRRR